MLPVALLSKLALGALRTAATSAPGLITGVTIATTAVANVLGMGEAKTNWNALAKVLEVEIPGIVGNAVFLSRGDWIAEDREGFLHAASLFGGDLQKLSGICSNLESQVDQVRDAYAVYWLEIGALAATILGYVVACQAMKLTPYTRVQAEMWLNRLVALTNWMIGQKTKILMGFLALAGSTLATSSQSLGQLFTIKPTGDVKVDFQRATISTAPPPQWLAPKRDAPAPYEENPPSQR
ncbi:hypothetical protein [Streptosporangium sp. NPDC087985]|uniref:hypothetical protein n=1 Tax=Streptosporangium sp. NPDC087985 TaxID=3366196 RepID=UPI0038079948